MPMMAPSSVSSPSGPGAVVGSDVGFSQLGKPEVEHLYLPVRGQHVLDGFTSR